jgi:hypothetical protein
VCPKTKAALAEVPEAPLAVCTVLRLGAVEKTPLLKAALTLAVFEVELYQTCPSATGLGSDERYCTFCPCISK